MSSICRRLMYNEYAIYIINEHNSLPELMGKRVFIIIDRQGSLLGYTTTFSAAKLLIDDDKKSIVKMN